MVKLAFLLSLLLLSCSTSFYVNKDDLIGKPLAYAHAQYGTPVYSDSTKESFRFSVRRFPGNPSHYRSFVVIHKNGVITSVQFTDEN